MSPEWSVLMEILQQGLVFSLVTMGVYVTSRVIRFDDLTVEGSFANGGAVGALCTLSFGSGWLVIPVALLAGGLCGAITSLLHGKLRMNSLLAGICTSTAVFSINLVLAGASLSVPSTSLTHPLTLLMLVGIALVGVRLLLRTDVGFLMRAAGENPSLVRRLGKDPERYKMIALILANSLTALGGALFVQLVGFFSITGSIGTLIAGLASVILGTLFSPRLGVGLIVGTLLYQGSFALAIELGMDPRWNSFVKAALIVILMQLQPRRAVCSA